MPIEVKDLLNLIGADEKLENVEDVKKHFSNTFIAKTLAVEDDEIAGKIMGKRLGALETVAKQEFGFTPAQVKDLKIEDILKLGASTFKSQLEEAKKAQGEPDKEVKKWQDKYAAKEKDFNDLDSMFKVKTTEFETEKNNLLGTVKGAKIGFIKKDLLSKVKFKDGFSDIEKIGFNATIDSEYKFDLDENDEIQIFGKDGKRVPKENGTGIMTAEELFPFVAKKLNVLKVNNTNGNQRVNGNQNNQNSNQNNNGVVRKAAPLRYNQV